MQRVTKIFAAVRFSEELLDKEVRESVALGKMYRELQRHVNCWDRTKVPYTPTAQFSVLLVFTFVSMNMVAVMIRVCHTENARFHDNNGKSVIWKQNKTEAAEF